MEKLKLYGCDKKDERLVFIIEKKELFLDKFVELMTELNFERYLINQKLLSLLGDVDNNYSKNQYSNELYEDKYFDFENEKYKFQLFFGNKKLVLVSYCEFEMQDKIINLINNFCKF